VEERKRIATYVTKYGSGAEFKVAKGGDLSAPSVRVANAALTMHSRPRINRESNYGKRQQIVGYFTHGHIKVLGGQCFREQKGKRVDIAEAHGSFPKVSNTSVTGVLSVE
jgi:hypothetical protein